MKINEKRILKFIVSISLPLVVGGISGYLTATEINGWFASLNKPSFNPPNYLFGPVWTTLYILMGISMFMIWKTPRTNLRQNALKIFALQLFLNFWWSILFFHFHLLFLSIFDIVAMWIMIYYTIRFFKQIKPVAGNLQIPYLLWVSFATLLNISFWWLNK